MEHLGALLLMYPRGRQFADDFPELRPVIRRHFAEGTAPASAAVTIAADILQGLLRQLGPGEKAALLAHLLEADPAEAKDLASRRLARGREPRPEPARLARELAGVAIFMAERMAQEGTLRRAELRHLLRAIDDALGADGTPLTDAFAKQ